MINKPLYVIKVLLGKIQLNMQVKNAKFNEKYQFHFYYMYFLGFYSVPNRQDQRLRIYSLSPGEDSKTKNIFLEEKHLESL